ncbi:hypothetical protein ACJX0J_009668, partial [Zea mays]
FKNKLAGDKYSLYVFFFSETVGKCDFVDHLLSTRMINLINNYIDICGIYIIIHLSVFGNQFFFKDFNFSKKINGALTKNIYFAKEIYEFYRGQREQENHNISIILHGLVILGVIAVCHIKKHLYRLMMAVVKTGTLKATPTVYIKKFPLARLAFFEILPTSDYQKKQVK